MSISHAGLRAWAQGSYPEEAAVELLVRTSGGRFANPGFPWIQPCDQPGWWRLDHNEITADTIAALSGGEQRLLRIVASLAGGTPVNLSADLPGLDRDTMGLVLAALAHANGSHEHADIRIDPDRGVAVLRGRLPSLHPWPDEGDPDDRPTTPPRPRPAAAPASDRQGTPGRTRARTREPGPDR